MTDPEFADLLSSAQPKIRGQVARQWPAKYDRLIPRVDMTQMINVKAWTSPARRALLAEQFDQWIGQLIQETLRDAWISLERRDEVEVAISDLSLPNPRIEEQQAVWLLKPSSLAAAKELKARVRDAIDQLSKSDQQILQMRFAGDDFKTVAKELKRRPATVRQAFRRAVLQLRKLITRKSSMNKP